MGLTRLSVWTVNGPGSGHRYPKIMLGGRCPEAKQLREDADRGSGPGMAVSASLERQARAGNARMEERFPLREEDWKITTEVIRESADYISMPGNWGVFNRGFTYHLDGRYRVSRQGWRISPG